MALAQGGLRDAHRASPCPISLPARNTLLVCRTRRASVAQRKARAGAAPILHATRGRVSGIESARGTARALIPGRR